MKTTPILLLTAALIAGGCQSAQSSSAPTKAGNVTVKFHEADNFTDVRESFGGNASQQYLDILSQHLQRKASALLPPGQKLTVTFTDIDLAGDFLPMKSSMQDIRVIKDIYMPRMSLSFQITDADGNVIKEGARRLTDLNFMNNLGLIGRNQPLYYDKALLDDWVQKELKS
jgi:hypothetical protein